MFTKRDFAKYPFINEAIKYVEDLSIKIDELANEEYAQIILDRARKRIKEGVEFAEVRSEWENEDVELLSFLTALAILTYINDRGVKNRYALAESKRASKLFKREDNFDKVLEIAKITFKWNVKKQERQNDGIPKYELYFNEYLKNSVNMIDSRWKLVNRSISQGYVRVTKEEICRLLQEEVKRKILENLMKKKSEISSLQPIVDEVARVILSARTKTYSRKFKEEEINIEAFPPCIKKLHETLKSGGNLSHMGRFTLTSFLINIGLNEKKVLKIFEEVMDFDETKTLYQIEHIAGKKGSRTKYSPPKCETLKTHGICSNSTGVCGEVRRPIDCYEMRLKLLKHKNKNTRDA